jgi:hypothetical protein
MICRGMRHAAAACGETVESGAGRAGMA